MTEGIGRCEWCGRVDHHLLDGECPSCQARSLSCSLPGMSATWPDDYDDVPLGIEAAYPGGDHVQ